jgi:glycerol-3-phosphate dehydrogenase subunit B
MKAENSAHSCQLLIIGAGMAGVAGALFAARRGIDTVQVGRTGETLYASGLFDLYGVAHSHHRALVDDPWQGLRQLKQDHPDHPFSRLSIDQIRTAMDQWTTFMGDIGLPYMGHPDQNVRLINSIGSIKRTFRVPASMWAGVRALEEKAAGLIVDIRGLRGFSARQMVGTLAPGWPNLTAATIDLPRENRLGPKYAEHIARGLEVAASRRDLADAIAPHLGRATVVGLPAILGMQDPAGVCQDLETRLGCPVFEIPTMPPAVAGVRLKESFDTHLPRLGIKTFFHHTVSSVRRRRDGRFSVEIGQTAPDTTIVADAVLLATGRFLGKGLVADRRGIHEPLLDLPVRQPDNRSGWHRESFWDPRGHAINLAGLEVDDRFRPVTSAGRAIDGHLFAAGTILAHQDWVRTKSGTGLAVATAYGAIEGLVTGVDR